MSEAINAIQHGVIVHALFHWIALTLPTKEDYEAQYTQAVQEIHGGRMKDIVVKRYRKYVICRVKLRDTLEPDPLHIHSLALLDAYSLHCCFKAWLSFLHLLHGRRHRMTLFRLRSSLLSWRLLCTIRSHRRVLVRRHRNSMDVDAMHRALQKLKQYLQEEVRWLHMLEVRYLERGKLHHKKYGEKRGLQALRLWVARARREEKRYSKFVGAKKLYTHAVDADREYRILTRHHMQRWVHITQVLLRLKRAQGSLLRRRWKSIITQSFGAWWTIFVVRYRINMTAARLVIKRYKYATWIAWFAWRRGFERSVLLRTDQRQTLDLRNLEATRALSQSLGHSRRFVLRNQAALARRRLQWINMCRVIGPIYFRILAQKALAKWRLVHAESSIAVCLQRIWRGHFIRKFAHHGRVNYLTKFKLRIREVRRYQRFKRLRLVFSVFKLFHVYFRSKWSLGARRLDTRRTLMRLMKNVPTINQMRQRINSSAFHYKLKHASNFVERLRLNRYQKNLDRAACSIRNADALQQVCTFLSLYRKYKQSLKLARSFSNRKYLSEAFLQLRSFRNFRRATSQFLPETHTVITRLALRNAFRTFHKRMEIKLTSKQILVTSVTKNLRFRLRIPKQALLELRVYALLRGIRRRLSYSFSLHHRVRSLVERLTRQIFVSRMYAQLKLRAQKQFISFSQRAVIAQYLAVVHLSAFKRKLVLRASQHCRRFALIRFVRNWGRFAKKRRLLRIMSRGNGIDLQLAIINARKYYGLREEYILITPEIIQNTWTPSGYKFWNTSYLKYSISQKIVPKGAMNRKHLLRIAISRADVEKMRGLRNWVDFVKKKTVSKLADRIVKKALITYRDAKCRKCMTKLRSHFLSRKRETKRFRKILQYQLKQTMFTHLCWLQYYARVSTNKRQNHIVSRLRHYRLRAFRHILAVSQFARRLIKIEKIVRRRILLRALYCVSQEKEMRVVFRGVLCVGKRACKRHLCMRFFRNIMPVIIAKRKLRRITRCFYLRHFMRSWLNSAAIEAVIYKVRSRKNSELKRLCFSLWQHYSLRTTSVRIAASEVKRRTENKSRLSTVCAWIEAIHAYRIRCRHDIVRERNQRAKKLFVLKRWQHHAIIREVELWKRVKYRFHHILSCVQIKKKQRKSNLRCELYFKYRALSTSFRSLRYFFMICRKERAKTQDVASVLLLSKCKCALKFWRQSVRSKLRTKKIVVSILQADQRLLRLKRKRHVSHSVEINAALDFLRKARIVDAKMQSWKEWFAIVKSKKVRALENAGKEKSIAYIKVYFAAWKSAVATDRLKRIAFAARLNLISYKDTLRYGFSGFVQNAKAGIVFKNLLLFTKRRCCKLWLVKYHNRVRTKKTILYMCSIFVHNELTKAWNHWKVIDGPARRFEEEYLQGTVFNRWYNLALTRKYHRRVTLHKVLHRWRDHVFSKGKAIRDVRRGRHLLLNLITKLQQQHMYLLTVAFSLWKEMYPVTNIRHDNVSARMPKTSFGATAKFTPVKSAMKRHKEIETPSRIQVIQSWKGELNELRASRSSNNVSKFRAMATQFTGLSKSTFDASLRKTKGNQEPKQKHADPASFNSSNSFSDKIQRVRIAQSDAHRNLNSMDDSSHWSSQTYAGDNAGIDTDRISSGNIDSDAPDNKLSIHELM